MQNNPTILYVHMVCKVFTIRETKLYSMCSGIRDAEQPYVHEIPSIRLPNFICEYNLKYKTL